ncbi:unnamed protein product [Mytilus coruscus]|uniref:Uncharacterized protein n=1 Tax=Mytilus coruscus TaxID=42192 RepID=A0A6J8AFP5_MYTCO|nr:unnamed protein product [Mytilus coruscus]
MTTITEDEENYVRMGFLLFQIGQRAVRFVFNNEFHPSIVCASIRKARKELNDLKKKNIIKLYQWNLLFPRQGQPDSEKFDVTLMITLLTNLTTLEHYQGLPLVTDTSTSADLGRIRYYRNHISHIEDAKIDNSFFSTAWEDIIQAVGRLGGQSMLDECKTLRTKCLERSTVPRNIKVQIDQILTEWKSIDSNFVETKAAKHVLECVEENRCVTITASSGVGKTATLRHVALKMETAGYNVLPVTKPHDIVSFYDPNQKTLFVIDDFCGTYSLNRSELNSLESEMERLKILIENKLTKIIVACRLQVYQDDEFKLLSIFRTCVCDLCSQDLCLSQTEKSSIAELYLETKSSEIIQYSDLYDCFPLLCKLYNENTLHSITDFFQNPFSVYEAEIDQLYTQKHFGKYCALALCVMFNNRLKEEWLTQNTVFRHVIENTCQACKLERGTSRLVLLDELKSLENTFIKKEQGQYRTLHDRMFDFLVSYFGQKMIECLIRYSLPAVIMQRFLLDRNDDIDRFVTIIPSDYHEMYIKRMIRDWAIGYLQCVFSNINMKIPEFRERFLCHLQTLDVSIQRKLAHTNDLNDASSVLLMCCQYDAIPFIRWCLNHGVDVNQCNCFGMSPLHESTLQGHAEVVKLLLDENTDINKCKCDGVFPLITACFNGNIEIVKLLLDKKLCLRNNLTLARAALIPVNWTLSRMLLAAGFPILCAYLFEAFEDLMLGCSYVMFSVFVNRCTYFFATDVNKCLPNGMSSLTMSCSRNEIKIVKLLLDNKADINDCRTEGVSPLYIAALHNNIELLKVLLDYKADINKCSPQGRSPLFVACQENHVEIAKLLLDNNADTNKCMDAESTLDFITCQTQHKETDKIKLDKLKDKCKDNGASPLFIACLNNNIEIVKLLLDNMTDINKCIGDGMTPLYIACSCNRIEIVKMLLYNKADVNRCTNEGMSPLTIACKKNNTEIVKILLYNKDTSNKCTFDGYPLHHACAVNNIEIVKLLLDSKANIDERRSDDGVFPLYIACWNNYIEIVKLLLNKKADIDQCGYDGTSLLHIACAKNHIEIVKILLDYKTDINKCLDDGASPLYVACYKNHIDIVKVLLDNKADINICKNDGASPLYVACHNNHIDIVKVLLDYKADINKYINKCKNDGASPFLSACYNNHIETVKILLDNKADIDKCMDNGISPLYLACDYNHQEIVKVLLDNNADIDKCMDNGTSPLFIACQNNHIETVKVLLDYKADINKCMDDGTSPFLIACYYNHKEIVRLLLAKGSNYNACANDGLSPLEIARRKGYSDIATMVYSYSRKEEPPKKKKK